MNELWPVSGQVDILSGDDAIDRALANAVVHAQRIVGMGRTVCHSRDGDAIRLFSQRAQGCRTRLVLDMRAHDATPWALEVLRDAGSPGSIEMWRVGDESARVPEQLYAFADGAGSTLISIHANGDGGAAPMAILVRDTTDALCRGLEDRLDQWQRDGVILPLSSTWLGHYRRAFQAHAVLRESARVVAPPSMQGHAGSSRRWEALLRVMRADVSQHGFEARRAQHHERLMVARKSMEELRHATPTKSAFLQGHRALMAEHAVAQLRQVVSMIGPIPSAEGLPRALASAELHRKGSPSEAILNVGSVWGGTSGTELHWAAALLHTFEPKRFPLISDRLDAAAAFPDIHDAKSTALAPPLPAALTPWMEAMDALRRRLRLRDFGELEVLLGYIETLSDAGCE